MGNYQCYKCGIPKNHDYIDELHIMRKHCRHHCPNHSLTCRDCEGYRDTLGCYHKFVFVWWCKNKNQR